MPTIEKPENVSGNAWVYGNACVYGNAWVYDNARVSGNAWVSDNARVYGNARVYDNARVSGNAWVSGDGDLKSTDDYITLGPIGTRKSYITLHRDRAICVRIVAGCWNGTLDEFLALLTDCREHDEYRQLVPAMHAILLSRMTPLGAVIVDGENKQEG